MSTTVFINALDLTEFAFRTLPSGLSSFDKVTETVSAFPEVGEVVVISSGDTVPSGGYRIIQPEITEVRDLVSVFIKESGDSEDIFYLYGDAPLTDAGMTERMFRNHRKYFASYTFADGYPYGLSPEILSKSALSQLLSLAGSHRIEISRKAIFELIQKDINAFDLETEISESDQRLLRVSLTADTKRNMNQLVRVIEAGGTDEKSVVSVLDTRPEILRTEPAFINVQVTGGCPQACSYCPYPVKGGDILTRSDEMARENWQRILEEVSSFCDDAVFGISMWGEPSFHSEISELVKDLLNYKKFRLVIETSGIGWKESVLRELAEISEGRIEWIVSLDAPDGKSYRKIRGEGWEEAVQTAEHLKNLFPENLYIQSVRMKDFEENLETFYRGWKEKGFNVIIQKHDHFCGFLPDRRVTDLTPVKRFPCWHLKRDLNILIDGTVPVCREDLSAENIIGNIFTEKLSRIWDRGVSLYEDHSAGKYPGICGKCDEYYTYNF